VNIEECKASIITHVSGPPIAMITTRFELESIKVEHQGVFPEYVTNTNQSPLISVVICTYNRADRLSLTLEAMTKQTISGTDFEVLVVDNRSTDNTLSICEQYQEQLVNFRYIYEPVQGLSKARNTGWQATQSSYIAYLDDDAIPCEGWIKSILEVFETVQPKPVGVGGPIYPLWEIPKPDWINSSMETHFTTLYAGNTPRWFGHNESPWGANVVYRREALEKAGGFHEQLGRKGQSLLSGEETLLNVTITSRGERFYYSPQAWVHHWVPKERINPDWLVRRGYWEGRSVALVDTIIGTSMLRHRLGSVWNLLKCVLNLGTLVFPLWSFPKGQNQIGLLDQAKLILSSRWGYFYQIWFGSFHP
jgi:glucosyl-dolichyl phosphate glucuronosyltransferase